MARVHLTVGAFGEEVKNLHRNLTKHGLAVPSSEVTRAFFGPGTRDTVIKWQRTHGLSPTGIVDERTDASLEAAPRSGSVQPPISVRVGLPGTTAPSAAATDIFAPEISEMFAQARDAASKNTTR